jgi:hypothetical protein
MKKVLEKLGELENGACADQLQRRVNEIGTLFTERLRFDDFTSNAEREWIEADYERVCRTAQREIEERVHELREQLLENMEA